MMVYIKYEIAHYEERANIRIEIDKNASNQYVCSMNMDLGR